MRALALNAGSSTVKAALYEVGPEAALARPAPPRWRAQVDWDSGEAPRGAVRRLLDGLWRGGSAVLRGPGDVDVVGHRVVHGGEQYRAPTRVTGEVKERIGALTASAPLHNRAALGAIEAAEQLLGPGVPHVATFDTAFHADLPREAYTYAGPHDWVDAGLRRYGFHGLSHEYVANRAALLLGRHLAGLRLISCHLGSGCSLAAVRGGRSVDTTMGFTPLEGPAMATRSGSVDPGLLIHLLRSSKSTPDSLDQLLNHRAGLAGLTAGSGDMRDVLAARARGDDRATLAFDVYVHRLRRCLGAMLASLGGLDAVAFTGGVGERADAVRAAALEPFAFLGVSVDAERNRASLAEADIATSESDVRILLIPAREDWAIAVGSARLLARAPA